MRGQEPMSPYTTIAIPDSSVSDNSDLRMKTEKLFQISRIAAIFKVDEILIYHDPFLKPSHARRERKKIISILKYIECPQYLRKRLIPLSRDTAAVGILSPLAIPHHIKTRDLKQNEIREAAIFLNQNRVMAAVGGTELLAVEGWKKSLKEKTLRVTVQIIKKDGRFIAKVVSKPPSGIYWGYRVNSSENVLSKALLNRNEYKIATSRSCEILTKLKRESRQNKDLLIAFGGPYDGIPEMLKTERKKISDVFDTCISSLNKYGTRSLRLEESMMITFSRLQDYL
jgi:predicted SPOUT superfamily RNA methylase MTH1